MELYPAPPEGVPADLTRPSRAYRWHAWLAALALALFVAIYLGLLVWFGAWGVRLLVSALSPHTRDGLTLLLPSALFLFFCAFLVAGLFVRTRASSELQLEITERDEPALFAFLKRVAADVGAPRPHRVFVSPDVNASVSYELTFANLLFPTRKNLQIGLGLVNCLTLAEFKAVMAHEFGHFGQDVMALGRWVYVAEQIAARIVVQRGVFDRLLWQLKRLDVRFWPVTWVMGGLLWAIRAVLDTAFRGVALALRVLGHEMELQADLVSVSVSGSDCLVHALHKLHAADDAYDRALGLLRVELAQRRPVRDLFAVQSRMLDVVRKVIDVEDYGRVPPLPDQGRETHRVFPEGFAQPPRMWSTHPGNREREDNVKRRYVASALDDRSAWLLFSNADAIRTRVTGLVLERLTGGPVSATAPLQRTLEELEQNFTRTALDPRYRGAYLGRSIVLHAAQPSDLYDPSPHAQPVELYPESLRSDLRRWRDLRLEWATLEALEAGRLTARGGVIRHRGRDLRRSELRRVSAEVKAELDASVAKLRAHDSACRTLHLAEAARLGRGWEPYLESLLALLHYAEHCAADLADAAGCLQHVLAVASADGRISTRELEQVGVAATVLHGVLSKLLEQRSEVTLPEPLADRLAIARWSDALPAQPLLAAPDHAHLAAWLGNVEPWVDAVTAAYKGLASVALESLLEAETHVARCASEARNPGDAPKPAHVPTRFTRRSPGKERPRQTQLDFWDRFQTAQGVFPAALRLATACIVLTPLLALGGELGGAHAPRGPRLHVVNGLPVPVQTTIGAIKLDLAAGASTSVDLPVTTHVSLRTIEANGGTAIEAFEEDVPDPRVQYVYNVASATPLVEWTALYRGGTAPPARLLGTPRWVGSRANDVLHQPPAQSRDRTRLVLESGARKQAFEQLQMTTDAEQALRLVQLHTHWGEPGKASWYAWLWPARKLPGFQELLQPLLAEHPRDITLRVIALETAPDGPSARRMCEAFQREFSEAPDDADLRFLAARCMTDAAQQQQALLEAYLAQPKHGWAALAAGFVFLERGQRADAEQALARVKRWLSFMAPVLQKALDESTGPKPR